MQNGDVYATNGSSSMGSMVTGAIAGVAAAKEAANMGKPVVDEKEIARAKQFVTMPKDAIFRIASMTKALTAVGPLTLYEDGRFNLLDPISKFMPEFANMKVLVDKTDLATGKHAYSTAPAQRQITVLDLLRHTSGVGGRFDENHEEVKVNYRSLSTEDGVKLLATLPLELQPGTEFQYSQGPEVAGRLIEVLSGKTFDE
jgi:CubicO group peptidase (beta-lactamase class C family)